MTYLVQAAQQLADEVHALGVKDATAEVVGEPDGFGFNREVRLNAAAVKALGDDVLEALAADDRIESTVSSNKGLRVVFVADSRADSREPYGLSAVAGS